MVSFADRLRSGWNAFVSDENRENGLPPVDYSGFSSFQPYRNRFRVANERSIISSIYAQMCLDLGAIEIRHTKHDDQDRYLEDIQSGLNNCLTVEANIDQAASAFKRDIFLSMFSTGVAAIVPVDTTMNPIISGSYDIRTMRVGEVTQWYPYQVRVNLYNERKGHRQEITLDKSAVAIVENPLYSVMNEPNSTLQRLIRKLALLDSVDEATSSGKMDLIIQLPYVVKSEARRQQADQRRIDIENQLRGNQYGIAYTDGTEKITQLNRPVDNNLLTQIEYLTNLLYTQLGLTPEIMNGTADEATMLNYYNRTLGPMVTAVTEAMKRTFLTKTARSQMQSVDSFRDPFKMLPLSSIAEIADKFARNEILSSNEIRQAMGFRPSSDPKADQLINSNMPTGDTGVGIPGVSEEPNASPASDETDGTSDTSGSVPASGLDAVDDAITHTFETLGIPDDTPPVTDSSAIASLDPSVMNKALDEIEAEVNLVFNGLGLYDDES